MEQLFVREVTGEVTDRSESVLGCVFTCLVMESMSRT